MDRLSDICDYRIIFKRVDTVMKLVIYTFDTESESLAPFPLSGMGQYATLYHL